MATDRVSEVRHYLANAVLPTTQAEMFEHLLREYDRLKRENERLVDVTREYRLPIPSDDRKLAWISVRAAKRPVLLSYVPQAWDGAGGWACWTFGGDYRTLRRGTTICLLEETKPELAKRSHKGKRRKKC